MGKGYGNVRPRHAKYFARKKNSAGPHNQGKRRPDPERFEEKEMLEWCAESQTDVEVLTGKAPIVQRDFGVGDRVRCYAAGPYQMLEGLVVKRDENIDGEPVWTVDYEGVGTNCHLSNELERVAP